MLLLHAVLAAVVLGASAQSESDCIGTDCIQVNVHKECPGQGRSSEGVTIGGRISVVNDNGDVISAVPAVPEVEIWCDGDPIVTLSWGTNEYFNIFLKLKNDNEFQVFQFQYAQVVPSGEWYASPVGFKSYVNGMTYCNTLLPLTETTPTTTTTPQPPSPPVDEVTLTISALKLTSFHISYYTNITESLEAKFVSRCVVEPDVTLVLSASGVVTALLLFVGALLAINVRC